jgi:uracil-DNA glycosylase family 4
VGVITSERQSCVGCPFNGAKVGTRGPKDSPFMIIGESPGSNEMRDGIPFVGMSWKVLQDAVLKSGVQIAGPFDPYITNAFHCWPGKSEKTEETVNTASRLCRHHLVNEINAYPRKLVLTLGNGALRAVTNNYGLKITKERGKVITSTLASDIKGVANALATIHPAFILRGGGNYRQFRGDVRYALELFNGGAVKRHPVVDYIVIDTPALLLRLLKYLQSQPSRTGVACDIETGSDPDDPLGPGGFSHIDDAILSIAICVEPSAVYIIPEEMILHLITRKLFKDTDLRWIWQNGKFDIKFLRSFGILEARVDEDIMLMSYTLDERGGRGGHDLETLSGDWLDAPNWKAELSKHKKSKQSYRVIPRDVLFKYQASDTSNTLRLFQVMRPIIDSDPYDKLLYEQTLIPASEYLSHVEDRGLCVDFNQVKANEMRLRQLAAEYAEPIFEAALAFPNSKYNEKLVNSHVQLSRLLFEDLRIPSKIKSTGDEVLDTLPPHPAVLALRKYRKIAKQLGTYVLPLYDGVASDRKIHTTFMLHRTATGRLACGDPMNLQNIPRDDAIRGQFVPAPGMIFIEPDLNQAELRSLAAMSGDPLLCWIYTDPNAPGVHDTMREKMYGKKSDWSTSDLDRFSEKFFINRDQPEDAFFKAVLDEQKMKAKNVNFGIIYGITEYGLAEQLECDYKEARKALQVWAETFPIAWKFIKECMAAPRRGLNLRTVFGNRKRHHVVTPENVHALEKEASNFPHQATASHIMLHGGIRVHHRYRKDYGAYVVNTVHDSMLIEVNNDFDTVCEICDDIVQVLAQVPIDWGIDRIPFLAEAKIGLRWGRSGQVDYSKWKAAHEKNKTIETRPQPQLKLVVNNG